MVRLLCIEAPQPCPADGRRKIFLAGGITGCPDWQAAVIEALAGESLVAFSPRRKDFPIHDPTAARQQIEWEFSHLQQADAVLFWFPCETLCPIVLYELGAWSMSDKPLFVGTHPDYKRRQDVLIQTELARPDVAVRDSIEALVGDVRAWLRKPEQT